MVTTRARLAGWSGRRLRGLRDMRFVTWLLTYAAGLAVAAWLLDGICFDGPATGQAEIQEKILPLLRGRPDPRPGVDLHQAGAQAALAPVHHPHARAVPAASSTPLMLLLTALARRRASTSASTSTASGTPGRRRDRHHARRPGASTALLGAGLSADASRSPPPRSPGRYRIALVCLGNICRSPMAARRARAAGWPTPASPTGSRWPQLRHRRLARRQPDGPAGRRHPDRRRLRPEPAPRPAVRRDVARRRTTWCSRWTRPTSPTSAGARERVGLFRDFDPVDPGGEVPDPYYGGDDGFEEVLAMVERTSAAIVARPARHARRPAGDHA